MHPARQWNLGVKLALVQFPFLLFAALSVLLTLWVSWQLDGGAAAVNEAGRMRMQAYRLSLSIGTGDHGSLEGYVREFDQSLTLLREGDADRPLFVPWDETVRERFSIVESDWRDFRRHWISASSGAALDARHLARDVAAFAADIGAMVQAIEGHMSRWTAMMHLLQMGMLALLVLAVAALVLTGYVFVLEPVARLKSTILRLQEGDLGARVDAHSRDEFGTLAEGFNGMASHLQSMYRGLEARVAEKTAELQEKSGRLEALYDVTAFVSGTTHSDELAAGFLRRVVRIAHADAAVLHWHDAAHGHCVCLAAEGMPPAPGGRDREIGSGRCAGSGIGVTIAAPDAPLPPGFASAVVVPVRQHGQVNGEVELYFHARHTLSAAECSLLDALATHLAGAMENLRLNALEKEAAVSQERTFIASELHDSIAQSLAFLKIQVQLMRDALASGDAARIERVLGEIDAGVRESYGDVRELLLHFRTRAGTDGIESALLTTLRKFEHQSGLKSRLTMSGHGLPLAPDLQLQVLHIVQEALSNVRKHAGATMVWLDVAQQPEWRFEVRDDGIGFITDGEIDETHVGLSIMRERAKKIGARLDIVSTPGRGTSVILSLNAQPIQPSGSIPSSTEIETPTAGFTLH